MLGGILPGIVNFETGLPIGRGATSEVFKVWDARLERHVALKVLRGDDPGLAARLLAEARAQARVEHPNVCRVYEAGERDGRPCILMQLVEGEPIDRAVRGLGLEERVALFATVAEAVAAAHAVGLIHRDLKPGNILVERDAEGRLVPYVLDFGLATELAAPAGATGQVLGTPGYLAPEQARGELGAIDRRSDVFGLGAVLYELLVGEAPFAAPSPAEALVRVLEQEPIAPRKRVPTLPRDLETITLACLEKAPHRRYASARELALDLRRWLAGEPIRVRPVSVPERLVRRVHRHPVATAAMLAAALAIVGGGVATALATLRGAERARHSQRFSARAERAVVALRLAHLLPLHDVRPDRARLESEVDALREEMGRLGEAAEPAARFAIGRTLAALGRHEEARRELEAAMAAGNQNPRVRLALGASLAALWREARERALDLPEAELRAERLELVDRELGEPARSALGALVTLGEADTEDHEALYFRALLEQLAGNSESARQLALASSAEIDWFYDGELLAGEIAVAEGAEALGAGRADAALLAFDAARPLRDRLLSKAESDPAAWRFVGDLARWRYEAARLADDRPAAAAAHGEAVAALDQGLVADAEDSAALDRLAGLHWRMGLDRFHRGEDPTEALAQARSVADRLATLPGSRGSALVARGNADWVEAQWRSERGLDPVASLESAADHLERARDLLPNDAQVQLSLGNVLESLTIEIAERGGDFLPISERSIAAFRKGVGRRGAFASRLWNGVCASEGEAAYYLARAGRDPGDRFERAIAACEAALEAAPGFRSARNSLGLAQWGRGLLDLWRTGSPGRELERAKETFEALLAEFPGRATIRVNLTGILLDGVEWGDPLGERRAVDLARAEQVIAPVADVFQNDFHHYRSRIARLRARAATAVEARQLLASAERDARRAIAIDDALTYHAELGLVLLERSRLEPTAGRLAAAESAIREALERDPDFLEGRAQLAALELLRAAHEADSEIARARRERAAAIHAGLAGLREDLRLLPARLGL